MELIFGLITVGSVLVATFIQQMRYAILALWISGLGVGALFLTMGAEFLAIIQWIISTLVTISFVFFAVMFGEYNAPSIKRTKNDILLNSLAIILGLGFAFTIASSAKDLSGVPISQSEIHFELKKLGEILIQKHLISLEVLALTLFLVLVGGGVVARSEGRNS